MKNLYVRILILCSFVVVSCTKEIDEDLVMTIVPDSSDEVFDVLLKIIEDNPNNLLNWDGNVDNINAWEGVVFENEKLTGLDIENKNITELTPTISLLEDLKELRLKGNNLVSIPDELFELKILEKLSISGSDATITLDKFLAGLFSLSSLTELSLDHFTINTIEGIGALNNLEILLIEDTSISTIPSDIGRLSQLREITLTNCEFFEISEDFFRLSNLETIIFRNNANLTTLPEAFDTFEKLTSLTITGSQGIQTFNKSVFGAVALRKLDMSQNNIGFLTIEDGILPEDIGMLTQLTELNLEKNTINSISTRLGELINLKTINFRDNTIKDIPKELGALTILDVLDISGNLQLNEIPEEVCKLEDLGTMIITDGSCGDLRVSSEYSFTTTEVLTSSLLFVDIVVDAVIDPVFVDGDGPFDLDFGEIGFEIHEVNKEDVLIRDDVSDQVLITQSTTQQFVNVDGALNLSFELVSPSVPNANLEEGRTYRVRLFNTEIGTVKTYLPAYELTVLE
ncbi:leucine-rich repeat domain-containing protein [Aquimarina sp. 433]